MLGARFENQLEDSQAKDPLVSKELIRRSSSLEIIMPFSLEIWKSVCRSAAAFSLEINLQFSCRLQFGNPFAVQLEIPQENGHSDQSVWFFETTIIV